MVLKAVGLLLSILNLSFVSFTPPNFFSSSVVSHVIVYNVQLRSSGTRARALNFRVKHGTKFWFAGSAFSAPSQYRN